MHEKVCLTETWELQLIIKILPGLRSAVLVRMLIWNPLIRLFYFFLQFVGAETGYQGYLVFLCQYIVLFEILSK